MPKTRKFKRTMGIVCEDSVITPGYLGKIRKIAVENGIWSNIDIFPVPPADVTTVKNDNPDKSPRKKRVFLEPTEAIDFEVEDEYKAQPTRYVREAQIRFEESGYEEAWAVYDLNGHARHEEAYNLALTEPIVKLGFSSVAIEHWFLLHFIKNNTAYPRARHVPLENYIAGYEKGKTRGEDIFESTHDILEIGFEHAAWLRSLNASNTGRCYQINPYTDMDLLIKSMLGIHETLLWGNLNDSITVRNIEFRVAHVDHRVTITVTNNSAAGIFWHNITVYFTDADRQKHQINIEDGIIERGLTATFETDINITGLLNIAYENHGILFEM